MYLDRSISSGSSLNALFRAALFRAAILLAVALTLVGCGKSGPPMAQIFGKITYSDGSIPTGSQTIITFKPAADTTAEKRKGASSDIKPDGSYAMYTMKPGDGVFYGKYKVIFFVILGSYRGGGGNEVAEEYTNAETTPIEVEINESIHTFDFKIEKAK